ncbi:P-loop containing nucleoside triphosphate hydrolase protein [Hyphopichia burtonii NRRL Y-1933]|uniref:Replication factor C subunit 2 n=1 Tax=Hyphopichia burtonii NRRL Y-1933 TaxID=984485 RepID=A0A1E4RQR5_9ASCO|nr:P-loop containing nucleoside triphosphate hydrolase protein [Hyphopichia burtonii NRRL Y-1933]ODV69622.1 P-loop containing nucleoside triphosphate hydrolase protein [Hyphopichia burtonii NRRL Y-1933]
MTSVLTGNKPKLEQYEKERLQHTPWVEKYRPKNLDDVASQDHAVKVLKKTLQSANLPHMLFYGPPGTGKTSTVLALAKQLYGPSLYKSRVLELNASDERGISIVRQKIKNFARSTISNASKDDLANYPCPPYKIIILDEADSMTKDAQSALRRTMENYANVTRFCLICNYITRIIDPLASRCSKFRFRLLNNDNALNRLKYIVKEENINLQNDEVLDEVLKVSNGDLRKAITFLQSATRLYSSLRNSDEDVEMADDDTSGITKNSIHEIAGVVGDDLIDQTFDIIESRNTSRIINHTDSLVLQGWSAQQVVDQLHDKFILNDSLSSIVKNRLSKIFFETDRKLNNGTDEHIQLLNLFLQISKEL